MKSMERKICTKCQREKQISEFGKIKAGKHGVAGICKKCKNSYSIEWKAKKRSINIPKLLEYLGGEYKCNRCSYTHDTHYPFDWHHIDPREKEHSPMDLLYRDWDILKKELDKCEFICACCHRIEHNE